VPSSPVDFHGCGEFLDGDVDVVDINRPLLLYLESEGSKGICNHTLFGTDMQLPLVAGQSALDFALVGYGLALSGSVSGTDLLTSLLGRHLSPFEFLGLTASAWRIPGFSEPVCNGQSGHSDTLRDCVDAFPSLVTTDEVVNVEINTLAHVEVFDLTTLSGSYFANGILTHNCRCYLAPYSENTTDIDPEYDKMRRRHREEVLRYARGKGVDLSYGPAPFEELAPLPTRET
jgi:hypothetical protein